MAIDSASLPTAPRVQGQEKKMIIRHDKVGFYDANSQLKIGIVQSVAGQSAVVYIRGEGEMVIALSSLYNFNSYL